MKRLDPKKLRAEAAQAQSKGSYRKALGLYENLSEVDPEDPLGPHRAGELYVRLGERSRAIVRLQKAARLYAEKGFLLKAIALCKIILGVDPAHTKTQQELAKLYALRRDREAKPAPTPTPETYDLQTPSRTPAVASPIDPDTTHLPGVVLDETDFRDVSEEVTGAAPEAASALAPTVASPVAPPAGAPAPPRVASAAPPPAAASAGAARSRSAANIRGGVPRHPAEQRAAPASPAAPPETQPPRPVPAQPPQRLARQPVTLAQGAPLDDIALAEVIPRARPVPPATLNVEDAMEISLDDLDFDSPVPAAAAPPPAATQPESAPQRPSVLPKTPLFSSLDETTLRHLIEKIAYESYDIGDTIAHQGEVGDSLYVIASGGVAVLHEGPPEREVARLSEGEFFGEIAVITDFPRTATVVATHQTEVLRLSRSVISELVAMHPQFLTAILVFVRDRLMDTLRRTSPLFLALPENDRPHLASRFRLLEVEAKRTLVSQGERSEAFFVLLAGRLEVSSERGGVDYRLGEIGPGSIVGERSLLTHQPATATVRTLTRAWVLSMERAQFSEVVTAYPMILEYVGALAEERKQAVERLELI